MTVVTTAPTYLFWRCAPPELRIPREFIAALGGRGGVTVAVGPHGSSTPATTLMKLGVDMVVLGECEEVVAALAGGAAPAATSSVAYLDAGRVRVNGGPASTRFTDLPALEWPQDFVARHRHHHHRFDRPADGPGAEVEASRGCPYSCSFCAKIDFRDKYRRRDLGAATTGDRRSDRRRSDLPLFHRRDFPAAAPPARGARATPDRVRRANADRSLED